MFKRAERKQVKIKIAITGPSGSGKTYSALQLAKGLGKKIALIDTENGSAALYAGMSGMPDFDSVELKPPFSTHAYTQAIKIAQEAGYDCLIVDSLSHQWVGEGGILSKKEQLDARGGNSFTNWAKLTPEHEAFKSAILQSDIHIIATMRSKQEYSLVGDDKGRNKVQKLGLAPVQREAMEYEFAIVFDIDMAHQAGISKDRTGMFDGQLFKITEETGKKIFKYLASGVVSNTTVSPQASTPEVKNPTSQGSIQDRGKVIASGSNSAAASVLPHAAEQTLSQSDSTKPLAGGDNKDRGLTEREWKMLEMLAEKAGYDKSELPDIVNTLIGEDTRLTFGKASEVKIWLSKNPAAKSYSEFKDSFFDDKPSTLPGAMQ